MLDKTPSIPDELEQLLRNLHLGKIAEILGDEIRHADKQQPSYATFLTRLLRAQYHHRQETALTWRIRQARIPEPWTLESFPFDRQPGVSRKQIRAFAELDFISRAENIVFIGRTGAGKTGLASGLLLKAIPKLDPTKKREAIVSKEDHRLVSLGQGCLFQPRCPHSREKCQTEEPLLLDEGEDHFVACHFVS